MGPSYSPKVSNVEVGICHMPWACSPRFCKFLRGFLWLGAGALGGSYCREGEGGRRQARAVGEERAGRPEIIDGSFGMAQDSVLRLAKFSTSHSICPVESMNEPRDLIQLNSGSNV